MNTVAIVNHKGGTGKTTSVIHLAAALGLSGHRTLVIDLDPQAFLTRTLGVGEPAPEASSLMLFNHEAALREVPVLSMRGFDLMPASSLLTKEMRRLNKPTDVLWAKESLDQGLDYDLVLFDTAAAVTDPDLIRPEIVPDGTAPATNGDALDEDAFPPTLAPGEAMTINAAVTDVPRAARVAEIGWKPE